ncbi:MAG: hypothetical protein EPO20_14830 [Betaproteobacteria bacterium]|nr:MAG: hypothetical protein EPO20_14830 [Betaproteobacteria bacterium]
MLGGLDFRSLRALFALETQRNGIGVVDSVAALKAMAKPSGKATYLVRGFATAGDGGGGFYWWDSADATADDGGTIIQLDAGGVGRFKKLF